MLGQYLGSTKVISPHCSSGYKIYRLGFPGWDELPPLPPGTKTNYKGRSMSRSAEGSSLSSSTGTGASGMKRPPARRPRKVEHEDNTDASGPPPEEGA